MTSTNGAVTSLEWDSSGEKLLVATDGGSVTIWSSRDHVLNSWNYLGGTTFSGEAIISAAFFHPGRKVILKYYDLLITIKWFVDLFYQINLIYKCQRPQIFIKKIFLGFTTYASGVYNYKNIPWIIFIGR